MNRNIGIVVVLYKDYHYLEECVSGLLASTQKHTLRICFCVDAINYNSVNAMLIEKIGQKLKIEYDIVFNYRGGPSVARNSGIKFLSQKFNNLDYFFFMDADNYLGEDCLDKLVECLDNAPLEYAFTYQDIMKFGVECKMLMMNVSFCKWRFLNEFYGETGNLIRAKVFFDSDEFLFDESELIKNNTGEDVEFFRRLTAKYKGRYCPNTKFFYRVKLAHRDWVYYPKFRELNEYMKNKNSLVYANAEKEFFEKNFYDVVYVSDNYSLQLLENCFVYDIKNTSRYLWEIIFKPSIYLFFDENSFKFFKKTFLCSMLLQDFFRKENKIVIYQMVKTDNNKIINNIKIEEDYLINYEEECNFVYFSYDVFADISEQNINTLRAKKVIIYLDELFDIKKFNNFRIKHFLESVLLKERERKKFYPEENFLFKRIAKFINHNEWLKDKIQTESKYIDSQYILETKKSYDNMYEDKKRFCFILSDILKEDDLAVIKKLCNLDECIVDLVVENKNNIDYSILDKYFNNIFIIDVLSKSESEVFLRQILVSYDVLFLKDCYFILHLLKDIKHSSEMRIVWYLEDWQYLDGIRMGLASLAPIYADIVNYFICSNEKLCVYLVSRQIPQDKVLVCGTSEIDEYLFNVLKAIIQGLKIKCFSYTYFVDFNQRLQEVDREIEEWILWANKKNISLPQMMTKIVVKLDSYAVLYRKIDYITYLRKMYCDVEEKYELIYDFLIHDPSEFIGETAESFMQEMVTKISSMPIAIFGASSTGKRALMILRNINVLPACFLDNDSKKWGEKIENIPILDVNNLKEKHYIVVASDRFYEISKQLQELGMVKKRDFAIFKW